MYEVYGGASLIIVQCALVRVSYPGLERRSLPNDKVEREREREREIIRQMCGKSARGVIRLLKCARWEQISFFCCEKN
jgi:hypothetical protein